MFTVNDGQENTAVTAGHVLCGAPTQVIDTVYVCPETYATV